MKGFKKDGKFIPTGNKSKSSLKKSDVRKKQTIGVKESKKQYNKNNDQGYADWEADRDRISKAEGEEARRITVNWDIDLSDNIQSDGDLQTISELISQGFTSGEIEVINFPDYESERGFWSIDIKAEDNPLTVPLGYLDDITLEEVGRQVSEGNTSGQLEGMKDEDDD